MCLLKKQLLRRIVQRYKAPKSVIAEKVWVLVLEEVYKRWNIFWNDHRRHLLGSSCWISCPWSHRPRVSYVNILPMDRFQRYLLWMLRAFVFVSLDGVVRKWPEFLQISRELKIIHSTPTRWLCLWTWWSGENRSGQYFLNAEGQWLIFRM